MSKHTKRCGYCGHREMAPCSSRMQADNCGRSRRKQMAYQIANTPGHEHRLSFSLVLMEFHEHKDEDQLDARLQDIIMGCESSAPTVAKEA